IIRHILSMVGLLALIEVFFVKRPYTVRTLLWVFGGIVRGEWSHTHHGSTRIKALIILVLLVLIVIVFIVLIWLLTVVIDFKLIILIIVVVVVPMTRCTLELLHLM